ncbi:MAG: choice-of-anchor Q domain-containing protein [Gammaproteobacteria bacterium]
MRHASLTPLFDAGARAAFEMLAGTAGLGSAPERQALLPRYARYYVALSRLPRRARRALQRRWRRSLAAIALLLALGQGPALAAVLTVGPDIAPDIVPDGSCALIEAMENANADAQTHADCLSGSGADTIALPASSTQLLIDVHNSTYGDNGLPVINSAITIEGNGSTIMRDAGADLFRIFAVSSRGDLTLNETTVSGGFADGDGGGIENRGGAVTLTDSTVFANGAYYRGGGVENDVDSTLTLTNSTVSNNYGFRGRGGGVYNGGTATLTNSTISGNSTFELGGGGVSNYGALTLTNSTISGNSATYGGGVYNGGTLILARSLLSGNTALNGAEIYGGVIADNFNLFGHSGITHAQAFSGFSPGANDLIATSDGTTPTALGTILVGTLADNGGPTKTHALAVGSPAIDTSPADNDCQRTDQRGIGRPQGISCDIGALEGTPSRAADLAISLTDSPDPLTVNQPLIYTIKVRNYGPSLARGVQITDNLPEGVVLNFKPPECAGTTTVTWPARERR